MSLDRLADFERRDGGQTKVRSRRPKRNANFDIQRAYIEAVNRPNIHPNYAADLREVMHCLVDGHVKSTLGSVVKKVAENYGESAMPGVNDQRFGEVIAAMFPTYAKASEITALSHVLVAKELEAYYSEGEIAKYMCKVVNKHLNKYGVQAKLESRAVVLHKVRKFSRKEARALLDTIGARETS